MTHDTVCCAMEVMCRDELVTDPLPLEVSADATAAEVLRDACALFGRAEMDTALEVGGVVWEADSGDVSAGSLGLEADSTVVLRRDRARVLAIATRWRGLSPRELPAWAWNDEVVVLAAVSHCGWSLHYASAALRDNEHVAGAAVWDDPTAVVHVSTRLRADEAFMLNAVRRSGYALEYASAALRDNETVVTAAVEEHAYTLQYASDRLRGNEPIVLKAVRQKGFSLQYASSALRDNETVVDVALENADHASIYVSDRLQKRNRELRKRIRKNGIGTAVVRAFRKCFAGGLCPRPQ